MLFHARITIRIFAIVSPTIAAVAAAALSTSKDELRRKYDTTLSTAALGGKVKRT